MRISDWRSDVCSSDLADVLGADFHAQAVHPVLAVRPAALAVHPLIAGRREDHAAFPGPRAEASLHAIFPVDVAETLGRIALDADEDGAERHVDARDAADRSEDHTSALQSLMRI